MTKFFNAVLSLRYLAILAIGLRWMSAASDEGDPKKDEAELQGARLDNLERLATLHEAGAVSDVEFEKMKRELLHV